MTHKDEFLKAQLGKRYRRALSKANITQDPAFQSIEIAIFRFKMGTVHVAVYEMQNYLECLEVTEWSPELLSSKRHRENGSGDYSDSAASARRHGLSGVRSQANTLRFPSVRKR